MLTLLVLSQVRTLSDNILTFFSIFILSGLTADSKTLIDRARVESQNHWFTYDEKMQVESVAQAVSNLAIAFGDSDDDAGVMSRPFGVAILFAG